MPFRFVHTADVHLDSPLRSLALVDAEIADLIANATRQTFVNTVDLCLEEQVDAFLIAGDLYDGALRSMKTAAFLTSELRRLTEHGVAVFVIKGNHDAESKITKHVAWPDGVHVFSGRGEAVPIEGRDVVVHGLSFAKPHVPDSLLPKYKTPVAGAINIGLLHTSLAGSSEHDVYAPCSVQQLIDHGYDYWALGHIHKREVHAGGPNAVVMPGIPQGRHVNEAGPKSVTLVTIADDRTIEIQERWTSVAQFDRLSVDLEGVESWGELANLLEAAFSDASGHAQAEHLVIRVRFTGMTPLAARLRRDADVLIEDARAAAKRAGSVLIEKIDIGASPPSLETKSVSSDPISELRRLIEERNENEALLKISAYSLAEEVQRFLPPEVRDRFGESEDEVRGLVDQLLKEGAEDVLARLSRPDDVS